MDTGGTANPLRAPMTRRMSNRDRIDQMRAEADATEKERSARRNAPVKRSTKSRDSEPPPPVSAVRFVWSVRNQRGEEVSFYPYAREAEARAEAERLADESERAHFVTKAEKFN
ncbi:MAG: hypothetical protein ACI89X_002595 [Planctomycetota bacterium]|jgi:hypothetical protein